MGPSNALEDPFPLVGSSTYPNVSCSEGRVLLLPRHDERFQRTSHQLGDLAPHQIHLNVEASANGLVETWSITQRQDALHLVNVVLHHAVQHHVMLRVH